MVILVVRRRQGAQSEQDKKTHSAPQKPCKIIILFFHPCRCIGKSAQCWIADLKYLKFKRAPG